MAIFFNKRVTKSSEYRSSLPTYEKNCADYIRYLLDLKAFKQ